MIVKRWDFSVQLDVSYILFRALQPNTRHLVHIYLTHVFQIYYYAEINYVMYNASYYNVTICSE